ncbi:MBL fold metallo-hydrolase [Niabella ginsengisoli]|uniref:MBL fold metallo-hydrolase n=1 Tax=Niabella ginsengisoli TaxID=522298 RepID=A0ABS9SR60_9BACT|nr:MBL fold metallo-hydrolase [Niabella ginsengisoli]MCH5600604.1 MBL fold metallo-hydrolase [Niabella ginsengisoli]
MPYPPLQITFLGTGTSSGVPMVGCTCGVCASTNNKDKRLRSSILLQSPETTIVIDSGPDFRQQMLTHNVNKLDAILLTHSHKDHIAGLDDVRAYNYFQKKPMDVFATEATLNRVKVEFDYAFAAVKYAGVPSIQLHTINSDDEFKIADLNIIPIPVWHMYMPVLGFRLGDFTYITDANRIDDIIKEKIKGSKVLVLNALRREKHISHFTLQEALDLADELEAPEAYFIHLSHQMGLHDKVSEELPPNRYLAFDGLQIKIP